MSSREAFSTICESSILVRRATKKTCAISDRTESVGERSTRDPHPREAQRHRWPRSIREWHPADRFFECEVIPSTSPKSRLSTRLFRMPYRVQCPKILQAPSRTSTFDWLDCPKTFEPFPRRDQSPPHQEIVLPFVSIANYYVSFHRSFYATIQGSGLRIFINEMFHSGMFTNFLVYHY